jgi:hypothetical protein
VEAALRAALAMALFLVLASSGLLIFQTPGTAEFVVTVLSLVVGLLFLAVVVFSIRRLLK